MAFNVSTRLGLHSRYEGREVGTAGIEVLDEGVLRLDVREAETFVETMRPLARRARPQPHDRNPTLTRPVFRTRDQGATDALASILTLNDQAGNDHERFRLDVFGH